MTRYREAYAQLVDHVFAWSSFWEIVRRKEKPYASPFHGRESPSLRKSERGSDRSVQEISVEENDDISTVQWIQYSGRSTDVGVSKPMISGA